MVYEVAYYVTRNEAAQVFASKVCCIVIFSRVVSTPHLRSPQYFFRKLQASRCSRWSSQRVAGLTGLAESKPHARLHCCAWSKALVAMGLGASAAACNNQSHRSVVVVPAAQIVATQVMLREPLAGMDEAPGEKQARLPSSVSTGALWLF